MLRHAIRIAACAALAAGIVGTVSAKPLTPVREKFVTMIPIGDPFATGQPAQPQPPTSTVPQLVQDTDSGTFKTREDATKELQKRFDGTPTAAEVAALRQGVATGTPEQRRRLEPILAKYLEKLPVVQGILGVTLKDTRRGAIDIRFNFAGSKGKIDTPAGKTIYDKVSGLGEAVRKALLRGDTAAAKAALEKLRDYVQGLNADSWDELNMQIPQADAVNGIQGQIDKIPDAEAAITGKVGPKPPVEAPKPKMTGPGPAPTGAGLSLEPSAVLSPGEFDEFVDLDGTDSRVVAPDGSAFIGHVHDLTAAPELAFSGTVSVTLAFETGPTPDFGMAVASPAALKILRIHGGASDLLEPVMIDTVNGEVRAVYTPAPGEDPLGIFALVQPAPIPPAS